MGFFKNLDSFGYPITFTHDKQLKFKSNIGSTVSILSKLGILAYFLVLITQVLRREQMTLTNNEFFRNFYEANYNYIINQENFDIAVQLTYTGMNSTVKNELETYFTINFATVSSTYRLPKDLNYNNLDQYGTFDYIMTYIPTVKCSEDRFGEKAVGKGQNLTTFYCPEKMENIIITGNLATLEKLFFQMHVTFCNQTVLSTTHPGKVCKTFEESYEQVGFLFTTVTVKNQYFDVEEFEEDPIKDSFKTYYVQTTQTISDFRMFKISQDQALLEDSLLSTALGAQTRTYNGVILDSSYNPFLNYTFWPSAMFFLQDEQVRIKQRRVFTLVDALTKIGGLIGIVTTFCTLLTGSLQKMLYYNDVISQSYDTTNHVGNDNTPSDQSTLKLTLRDYIKIHCRRKLDPNKYLQLQALNKVLDELDITNYVMNMRKVTFLSQVLLNKTQRNLMQYYLKNLKCQTLNSNEASQSKANLRQSIEKCSQKKKVKTYSRTLKVLGLSDNSKTIQIKDNESKSNKSPVNEFENSQKQPLKDKKRQNYKDSGKFMKQKEDSKDFSNEYRKFEHEQTKKKRQATMSSQPNTSSKSKKQKMKQETQVIDLENSQRRLQESFKKTQVQEFDEV